MNIAERRDFYAASITAGRGINDSGVQRAFATVPREAFVGAGPWSIFTSTGYVKTSSSDPRLLYEDVVVALSTGKRINNGQPSLHALCMSAAGIHAGDRVLHIGCGSGYYTAILAELATPAGEVLAWDIEPELAAAAGENLRGRANVSVSCRSGTSGPIAASDVIYVSAGCTRPMKAWVEALRLGGRLLFPLTPGWDFGAMLKVTRHEHGLHAKFVCACSFIPCVGGSDPAESEGLLRAFSRGGTAQVSSLHFGAAERDNECWFMGDGWHLSTRPSIRLDT
jgi:protein-L-isoaspartate(D-aspartate) O-methyltransferase